MVDINLLASANVWKYIGMELAYDSNGLPGVHMVKNEGLKQYFGGVHGGMIATVADTAMAVAVNNALGKDGATTVEMKINYLQGVTNSDLFSFAKIVKQGKHLITLTADVIDEQNNLIAMAMGTFMVRPIG